MSESVWTWSYCWVTLCTSNPAFGDNQTQQGGDELRILEALHSTLNKQIELQDRKKVFREWVCNELKSQKFN